MAANNARDEVTRTQGEVDDALGEQGRLAALQTQHTADLDRAENSLQTVKDAAGTSASTSVVTTGGDAAGGDAAGAAGGGKAAEEIGDGWEEVAPLSEEEAGKAAAAVSDVGKGESTLAKLTAVSSEDDWNPAGLLITAGLAIGTLFAGIFGHHRDGLPKHPPVPPPVINASTQFGVNQ